MDLLYNVLRKTPEFQAGLFSFCKSFAGAARLPAFKGKEKKKSEELQITFEKVMKSFLNDAN